MEKKFKFTLFKDGEKKDLDKAVKEAETAIDNLKGSMTAIKKEFNKLSAHSRVILLSTLIEHLNAISNLPSFLRTPLLTRFVVFEHIKNINEINEQVRCLNEEKKKFSLDYVG